VHRRDLIGRHIAKYGTHEPLLTQWLSAYLATSSRGIFVDVGANIGWHAIHAAQHKTLETVVAFEPDAFNAWLLDRNLSLNGIGNVVVNTCAVGARPGLIRLHRYKSSNRGRHSVLADYGYGSSLVPMIGLDAALEGLGMTDRPVLIVKIDVEGYEPEVVAGATQTLARADVAVIEYSPGLSRAGGLAHEDMLDRLYAAGLKPYRLSSDGWTGESTVGKGRFDGQIDLIWIRAGKEPAVPTNDAARLIRPVDKAILLQLAETWKRLAENGQKAPG
jgi:FkbM family methyltransferase